MRSTERAWQSRRLLQRVAVPLTFLMAAVAPSAGQQVTGVLGEPSATTTIDGKQIPPAPMQFGGVIKESAKDSKPWWPPRVVPAKGAPNVLLIMTDDQGYGVPGTFGGVIPTPSLDRVANGWVALHPVPLHCSLLADAGSADHRAQPPLSRLRRHRRVVHRLPGLRFHHRAGELPPSARSSRRTATLRRGLAKTTIRQVSNTAARPGPSTNGPWAWGFSIFMAFWEARPTSGRHTFFAIRRQCTPWVGQARLQPHH